MTMTPYLSLSIWVPIIAGVLVILLGSGQDKAPLARKLALLGSLAGLVVAVPLYTRFDPALASM